MPERRRSALHVEGRLEVGDCSDSWDSSRLETRIRADGASKDDVSRTPPKRPVLFHPDYDRRLRSCTESADPAPCGAGARGLRRLVAITAGGDFHPALRTSAGTRPAA